MFQLDKIPCLNVSLESLISMVLKALSTTGSYESLACLSNYYNIASFKRNV